ncbi:MAG: hypothetical protein C5B59_16705 [Bacteroidetes bacterium]|nr:MAG: hypothetical protein C5B59_16705 [Bacteroidota bacterium]
MLKFNEIKIGDILMAEYDGQMYEGEVVELNHEDHEVCLRTDVQEFWFTPDQLFPIALDDDQMKKFHFEKEENGDGSVKYLRGPFRVYLPQKGNFSSFEMWYREDRRHMTHPVSVHELQNHYHQMTKVGLSR